MIECVVDSSVVLAFLFREPGWEIAASVLDGSHISSVNHSEVVAKLMERGASKAEARDRTAGIGYTIHAADAELALEAGSLRPYTRRLGFSLADRFCIALGRQSGLPVYTADRVWAEPDLGADIRLIR